MTAQASQIETSINDTKKNLKEKSIATQKSYEDNQVKLKFTQEILGRISQKDLIIKQLKQEITLIKDKKYTHKTAVSSVNMTNNIDHDMKTNNVTNIDCKSQNTNIANDTNKPQTDKEKKGFFASVKSFFGKKK